MRYQYTAIFFFNDTATTEIYTLSLHDALPISHRTARSVSFGARDYLSETCTDDLSECLDKSRSYPQHRSSPSRAQSGESRTRRTHDELWLRGDTAAGEPSGLTPASAQTAPVGQS